MKKENIVLSILIGVFFFMVISTPFVFKKEEPVMYSPQGVPSSVIVGEVIQLSMSPSLESGIDFGSVSPNSINVPALENSAGAGSASTYSLTRLPITNTDIVVCVYADGNLVALSGHTIPLSNEKFSHSSNPTNFPPAISIPSQNTLASHIMTSSSPNVYYRFWLDVPSGTIATTYTNNLYFIAINSESGCP